MTATKISDRRRGPGAKANGEHPTRHQLLDAAMTIAENDGFAALSVGKITRASGLAQGTFYVHFADRSSLLVALHARFHDDLFARIGTIGGPPGHERAAARITAFLDGCRQQPGVRSMLLDARNEPAIRAEVRQRNDQSARALAADLRPATSDNGSALNRAVLIVAATAEVASRELDAKRRIPQLRAALLILLD
jgi:TetR/AcrR family transcriptional regulator, transcriptional repressor for nem operon